MNVTAENPWSAWSARSAWPGHPAILPPLPRVAKSEALASALVSTNHTSTHAHLGQRSPAANVPALPEIPAYSPPQRTRTLPVGQETHRLEASRGRKLTSTRRASSAVTTIGSLGAVSPARDLEPRKWPSQFDDWMMDIVRRRALRLNSGARRRGVHGTVRAVDLAYILDKSADADGRWRCALCHGVVTLNDLSFDHVVALADGGEHAPHNLVPAHRKCNEIKGSEKAQYRAQALDRWLSEWASSPAPLAARSSGGTAAHSGPRRGARVVDAAENTSERRYA